MKVVGIDPGNNYISLVLWDTKSKTALLHYRRVEKCQIEEITDDNVFLETHKEISLVTPAPVVIEVPQSYGIKGNVFGQSMIDTCRIVGRLEQALEMRHSIFLVSRPSIAGHFSAKGDAQIRAALRDRFCTCRAAGPCKKGCPLHGLNNDERSALAAAVAWSENPNIRTVE